MLLARLMRDKPCELRADLQQTYGLNLDGMGRDYSVAHAACCAAQLPAGARVWRDTAAEWTEVEYLLASIEFSLRVLKWKNTEDGIKDRNAPEPIRTPASREQDERHAKAALANRAWVDEVLRQKTTGGE